MDSATIVTALPYALPFVVGVLTLVVTKGSNKQAEVTARLTNQRADFEAIVKPLRDELSEYRTLYRGLKEKVDGLEGRLDVVERDRRLLLDAVVTLKDHVDLHLPDLQVVLPRRVIALLREKGTDHE